MHQRHGNSSRQPGSPGQALLALGLVVAMIGVTAARFAHAKWLEVAIGSPVVAFMLVGIYRYWRGQKPLFDPVPIRQHRYGPVVRTLAALMATVFTVVFIASVVFFVQAPDFRLFIGIFVLGAGISAYPFWHVALTGRVPLMIGLWP
jgi:hypothetical protein